MIEGRFGENGQIYLEIDLIGGDNFSFPVETLGKSKIQMTIKEQMFLQTKHQ